MDRTMIRASAMIGVPNKPMVPTAHTSPTTNPLHLLRRHIGQAFGRFNDQRIRGRDSSLRRRQTE